MLRCEQAHYHDGPDLDVLAAAYAADGQFSEAVKWAQAALALVNDVETLSIFTERLQLYLSGHPCCEE
jgi:hypothetical protein